WMQYTVTIKEAGKYTAKLSTAGSEGNITLIIDGKPAIESAALAGTKNARVWEVQRLGTVILDKGVHIFRLLVNKSGFNIKQLLLSMELENSVVAPGEQ